MSEQSELRERAQCRVSPKARALELIIGVDIRALRAAESQVRARRRAPAERQQHQRRHRLQAARMARPPAGMRGGQTQVSVRRSGLEQRFPCVFRASTWGGAREVSGSIASQQTCGPAAPPALGTADCGAAAAVTGGRPG